MIQHAACDIQHSWASWFGHTVEAAASLLQGPIWGPTAERYIGIDAALTCAFSTWYALCCSCQKQVLKVFAFPLASTNIQVCCNCFAVT